MWWEEILSLLWALVVIAGVLALAWWFTRYVVGQRVRRQSAGRNLKVLEDLPLSRDQRLLLVRLGEQILLLGVTQGGISRLGTLSPDEAVQPPEEPRTGTGGAAAEMPFAEALRRVLQQRKK